MPLSARAVALSGSKRGSSILSKVSLIIPAKPAIIKGRAYRIILFQSAESNVNWRRTISGKSRTRVRRLVTTFITKTYPTRYNPIYCLHINQNIKQFCRFRYPKEIIERTFVRKGDHGHPKLVAARNDQYVNPHSRLQLQGWRANMNLKPILSIHADFL